jgi:catechol 2,3-dioxygenase-like lactoylglutathione lyase family enzyme
MIGYVTLGTNDLQRAGTFYDELLSVIGAKRTWNTDSFVLWSVRPDLPGVAVIKPFDGQPATPGNGTMVALAMSSTANVDAVYKKAMELGAKDEGPAGARSENFYGGYFRDLDGNKLCAFYMKSS